MNSPEHRNIPSHEKAAHAQLREAATTGPRRPCCATRRFGHLRSRDRLFLAQQRFVIPIEAAWLKPRGNQLSLTPLGIGSLDYDAVTFLRGVPEESAEGESGRLKPTLFYRNAKGGLAEVCELTVPFRSKINRGTATVQLGAETFSREFTSRDYDFGVLVERLDTPARIRDTNVSLTVTHG
jgi:hypothetical protein